MPKLVEAIETGGKASGKYLLSVADRAVAFTYWRECIKQQRKGEALDADRVNETLFSAFGATFPAFTGIFRREFYSENPKTRALLFIASAPALLLDVAVITNFIDAAVTPAHFPTFPQLASIFGEGHNPLAAIVHNPLEAVAAKIGVNALTHMTVDTVGAGLNVADAVINRIKNFRPAGAS